MDGTDLLGGEGGIPAGINGGGWHSNVNRSVHAAKLPAV